MSSRKAHAEPVVRCYEVGSPTRHPDGYTIYKVTQQLIQIDALERNVQESVVWKRYNDFKKLYKAMFSLHKALHRREEFPPFVKAQLFNRFEEPVIEERRRSAQDLLNFVGQRVYLTNSVVFKQFFQGAEPVAPAKLSTGDLLKPVTDVGPRTIPAASENEVVSQRIVDAAAAGGGGEMMLDPASVAEAGRTESPLSLPEDVSSEGSGTALTGTWLHRQNVDDLSSADDDTAGSEDDESELVQDSSVADPNPGHSSPGRSLPGGSFLDAADMAVFDTVLSGSTDVDLTTRSNAELLAMLTVDSSCDTAADVRDCGGPHCCLAAETEQDAWMSHDADSTLVEGTDDTVAADSGGTCLRMGSVIESGTGDLTMSPVHRGAPPVCNVPQVPQQHRVSATETLQQRLKLPSLRPRKVDLSSSEETKYIVDAAELISQAQEHEIAENYPAAYSHYRSGIEILVKGVQKDSNMERQQAVSMKISKYLLKADELYQTYLVAADGEQVTWNRWGVECETVVGTSIALLRSPSAALKNFRVIGVVGNVLLVVDTATEGSFVIKVLYKSCRSLPQNSIVPTHLPYVVSLVRFYETDSAIYLQLQHAAGGRLWAYVGAYLNQCADVSAANVHGNAETQRPANDVATDSREAARSDEVNAVLADSSIISAEVGEESSVEAEAKSKLSLSDLDSMDDSRETVSHQVSFSSLTAEPLSPGFGEVLRSANPAMKCFSIDSSGSERTTSRQVSCSSADDGICHVHSAPMLSGVCQLCPDDGGTPRAGTTQLHMGTCTPDETSIYDLVDPTTADNQNRPSEAHVICPRDVTCGIESGRDGIESGHNDIESGHDGIELGCEKELDESRNAALRRSSVKNSGESCAERRRRRTLSSAFGELDLAEVTTTGGAVPPRPVVQLPESCVRQWAAEMVVAISRLHAIGIVCRDLRPANILLGDRGHILLTYFSQWNTVECRVNDQALDGFYSAPELTGVHSVLPACDWWSLGALLYELLTGQSLQSSHPAGITSHTEITIPEYLSAEATSLLRELLRYNPLERLGGGAGGSDDVRSHPFFSGIEWNNLLG